MFLKAALLLFRSSSLELAQIYMDSSLAGIQIKRPFLFVGPGFHKTNRAFTRSARFIEPIRHRDHAREQSQRSTFFALHEPFFPVQPVFRERPRRESESKSVLVCVGVTHM